MPNWKSYEASVRLLSAIIAAHPGLKLNYDEIGRFYGGGTKYKSVWDRMTQLTRYADALKAAVESGDDPINVELAEGTAQGSKPKAKDISKRFGGDCTKSAIENRFRRIKSDAKLINDAVAKGIDVIKINVGDTDGAAALGGPKEIQQFFGSDATAGGIRFQFSTRINPNVAALKAARAAGEDCKDVPLGAEGKDIAHCMGDDVTGKALGWQVWNQHKHIAKLQLAARAAGQDPQFVDLDATATAGKGKAKNAKKEISILMGPEVTPKAISMQMAVRFRLIGRLQQAAVKAGQNPELVDLNVTPNTIDEVARIMGSDATPNGLRFQFTDKIRPVGYLQLEAVNAGLDPKDVDLSVTAKTYKDIATHMGSDTTKGAIEWQFRRFKIGAQLQRQAVKNGVDPLTVNVDVNVKGGAEAKLKQENSSIAHYLNDDTTAFALEHRFRPIKKDAAVMKAAIAGSYQQGITGKAVSTRFERMKKEPCWNLSINTEPGDGASATTTPAKGTPRKRGPNKGTPKGKVAVMNNGAGGSDDEEVSDFATPSKKKAVLNKVKGGRVTKAKGKGKASQSFENEEDMDDFDPDTKHIIKAEHSMSFDSNGNGYSNGNGSSFGNGYFSGESPTHNNAFRFDNSEGRVYGDEEDEENTDEI